MDSVEDHNRRAWDRLATSVDQPYSKAVSPEDIARARRGDWSIKLTDQKPVPRAWLPRAAGLDILCLASGGGQQAPVLAAAGARVTSVDLSDAQLVLDRLVAEREQLTLRTIQGSMLDLEFLSDGSFDAVVLPVANLFVPDVRPVWTSCLRVLRVGGVLLSGFLNPAMYLFDVHRLDATGELVVRYPLPFRADRDLPTDLLEADLRSGTPLEFSHSLETQIGGQLEAGFLLTGLYEDRHESPDDAIATLMPTMMATRAIKP